MKGEMAVLSTPGCVWRGEGQQAQVTTRCKKSTAEYLEEEKWRLCWAGQAKMGDWRPLQTDQAQHRSLVEVGAGPKTCLGVRVEWPWASTRSLLVC